MQKNVDKCLIQIAFLHSSEQFARFMLTTRGGGKNIHKQSNKRKSKKNKTRKNRTRRH